MKKLITLALILTTVTANAGTSRVLDAQFIKNGSATLTLPLSTDVLIGRDTSDTLTNKTLTSPAISNPTGLTRSDVGLSNVDNTSDANKPISTATQNALDLKENALGFTPENVANKDNGALSTSTTSYPTSGAVKTYVDTAVAGVNVAPTVTGSPASPTLIVAGNGISFASNAYFNINFIEGNLGAVDISANPQIAAGSNIGQELVLIGTSDTNNVRLQHGDGLSLNGEFYANDDSMISLVWDGLSWVEKSRR